MLAAAFFLLDMFGQQVARIGDVTKDGIDELVVTDPIGDRERPREGRVLIIDPTNWSIVRELEGEASEMRFGDLCSVGRSSTRTCLAVTSVVKDLEHSRLRLIDTADFSTLWMDEIETTTPGSASYPNPLCVVDSNGPTVFLCERSNPADQGPKHLVLWKRDLKGRTIAARLLAGYLPHSGQNMYPQFDAQGDLTEIFVSSIVGYSPPITKMYFPKGSRLDRVRWPGGEVDSLLIEDGGPAALGVSMLHSNADQGRFSGELLAIRRKEQGGMQVLTLDKSVAESRVDIPRPADEYYWGASMCWTKDLDDDGHPDLVIGCPRAGAGSILLVGSKSGSTPLEVGGRNGVGLDLFDSGCSFGTQVAPIPDQDGDGNEDLVVAATSIGGAGAYPAALSIVSTKSWEIIRVVFERDLVRVKSGK